MNYDFNNFEKPMIDSIDNIDSINKEYNLTKQLELCTKYITMLEKTLTNVKKKKADIKKKIMESCEHDYETDRFSYDPCRTMFICRKCGHMC